MGLGIKGDSFAGRYKRVNDYPIDSTDVWDTIENAHIYARNTDTVPYVPYAGQVISVLENGNVYKLIKDSTIPETDGKKHFKLAVIGSNNDNDDRYLRRDIENTAKKLIHFLEGIDVQGLSSLEDIKLIGDLLSSNYVKGSNGFGIYKDELGKYHLDIAYINVLEKMIVETIEVKQSYHVRGAQYLTKAGLIVSRVDGNTVYFTNKDADGNIIFNQFVIGDYAYHKGFNLNGSRVYWNEVTGVGEDFITMDISGDTPRVGDSIVQLGNKNDKSRQAAIILDSNGIVMYKGISSKALPAPYIEMGDSGVVFRGKFISEATGKDIDDSLEEITQEVSKIKEQTDKSFTIWFEDYMPTLENEPASLWTNDNERYEHEQDIFYNTSVKAGEGGRAFRYEEENGVYGWNEITDKDTLAALEQVAAAQKAADAAQETADSKKRVFVTTPDTNSVYDIGDMWVTAVYDDGTTVYKNDSLVCITAKAKGAEFLIAHWKPTSKVTTALFENLGNQIIGYVNDSNKGIEEAKNLAGKGIDDAKEAARKALEALGIASGAADASSENATVIQQTRDSITALAQKISFDASGDITNINTSGLVTTAEFNTLLSKKISFDADGHVTNISTSGLVTASGFAQMFSDRAEADGYVKRAEISTFITEDDAGRLISNATISADKIDFKSGTVKINSDNIDFESGTIKIKADRIDLDGDVFAKAIMATGLNVNDNFMVDKEGKITANEGVFRGKIETAVDGKRIVIDPDGSSISLFDNNGNLTGIIKFERFWETEVFQASMSLYKRSSNGAIL